MKVWNTECSRSIIWKYTSLKNLIWCLESKESVGILFKCKYSALHLPVLWLFTGKMYFCAKVCLSLVFTLPQPKPSATQWSPSWRGRSSLGISLCMDYNLKLPLLHLIVLQHSADFAPWINTENIDSHPQDENDTSTLQRSDGAPTGNI